MNFLDLARKRFSARDYISKSVEQEKLMQVLEAVRIAPSATNRQLVHFIALNTEESKIYIT